MKSIQELNHKEKQQISPSKCTPPCGLSWQLLQHYHNQFSGSKEVIRDAKTDAEQLIIDKETEMKTYWVQGSDKH